MKVVEKKILCIKDYGSHYNQIFTKGKIYVAYFTSSQVEIDNNNNYCPFYIDDNTKFYGFFLSKFFKRHFRIIKIKDKK